ncbi:MAG: nitrate reductase [Opitutaceae bacterium]|nr:nitrate reductase [Opitutaceae bacterium]
MTTTLTKLLRAHTGPMTSELVQRPGEFGLGRIPERLAPAAVTHSVCGFCATGCSLKVHLGADGSAINLSPQVDYPVNLGMACPKGWEALTPLAAPDRATTPLLRNPLNGQLEPVDWPRALQTFVARMKAIQAAHGKRSIAFLSTGQIPTEEMMFLGSLFKFGMGGLHGDSNTRQCMATAHVAYKQAFGFDAPPYTYADFEESDVLVFVGANPAIAHPIMWQRVMRNRRSPQIIVVDPRRTETAMCATRHVAIQPRGDLWLFYGISHALIARGLIDRAFVETHTTGFESFAAFLDDYTPEACAPRCGVSAEDIRDLASIIAAGKAVSFWWTMGVNQGHESTRVAQSLINLALITGNIGRPGTGANSITGQCNAMGSRLYANATSLLGGRSFEEVQHRADVASILGFSEAHIPRENSWAYDQIIDGIERGAIRGLWVVATNPAHSWINHGRFKALRDRLEFLVVQDMYTTTETARAADLILPAAGWGEKEGTFINSERRIGVTRKVARAPGQALSDFAILQLIAQAWGCGEMFRTWSSPEAVFQTIKELSRGRPCDITGIRDYAHLDEAGGIQWPWPETRNGLTPDSANSDHSALRTPHSALQERRLFADGRFFTADGRARILFDPPRPAPEMPDETFPFWLNTGRGSSAQWHTGTRTNKSDVLRKLAPRSVYVEINPEDADRLGIEPGGTVVVRSRRGGLRAAALLTATVQPGQVFVPMHFDGVNQLTFPAFDPHSRQPSYKACAVAVERADEG